MRVLKTIVLGIILAAAVIILASCNRQPARETPAEGARISTEAAPAATVLLDTASLRIEAEGQEIRVYDLTGESTYIITWRKTRTKKEDVQHVCQAETKATTATIEIKQAFNIVIVTDRTTGETYYIKP